MLFRHVYFHLDDANRILINHLVSFQDARPVRLHSVKIVYRREISTPLVIRFPSCMSASYGIISPLTISLSFSLLLGYGFKSTAYYVRCHHCHERFRTDPLYWHQWQEEMRETEKKLAKLRA